jgi:hypothetical protein
MAPLASARAGNIPAEEAADVPITGTPTQAAERFAAYAYAGTTCRGRSVGCDSDGR